MCAVLIEKIVWVKTVTPEVMAGDLYKMVAFWSLPSLQVSKSKLQLDATSMPANYGRHARRTCTSSRLCGFEALLRRMQAESDFINGPATHIFTHLQRCSILIDWGVLKMETAHSAVLFIVMQCSPDT